MEINNINVNNNLLMQPNVQVKQQVANDKFLNMLAMFTGNDSLTQIPTELINNADNSLSLNIMELLLGKLNDTDLVSNSMVDVEDNLQVESSPNKKYKDETIENLIGALEYCSLIDQNNLSINDLIKYNKALYNDSNIGIENKPTVDLNDIYIESEPSTKILDKEINLFNGVEKALNFENKSTSTEKISVQAEKLISQIENHRDEFKKEINFHAQLLTKDMSLVEGKKIITVSDESNEIKSQVLSQIKDKIVFMTKGTEANNEVKQVTMELHPHSLGKVDIKMTFNDDKLTVEIKALNEETQKILSSNIDELASILRETSKSSVIVLKSNDHQFEQQVHTYINEQNSELYYDAKDQNDQGRQKNHYYEENTKESEEDSVFLDLINLKNLKLNV